MSAPEMSITWDQVRAACAALGIGIHDVLAADLVEVTMTPTTVELVRIERGEDGLVVINGSEYSTVTTTIEIVR